MGEEKTSQSLIIHSFLVLLSTQTSLDSEHVTEWSDHFTGPRPQSHSSTFQGFSWFMSGFAGHSQWYHAPAVPRTKGCQPRNLLNSQFDFRHFKQLFQIFYFSIDKCIHIHTHTYYSQFESLHVIFIALVRK